MFAGDKRGRADGGSDAADSAGACRVPESDETDFPVLSRLGVELTHAEGMDTDAGAGDGEAGPAGSPLNGSDAAGAGGAGSRRGSYAAGPGVSQMAGARGAGSRRGSQASRRGMSREPSSLFGDDEDDFFDMDCPDEFITSFKTASKDLRNAGATLFHFPMDTFPGGRTVLHPQAAYVPRMVAANKCFRVLGERDRGLMTQPSGHSHFRLHVNSS